LITKNKHAMTTFTVHTDDKEQLKVLKAFMKALKIKFDVSNDDTSYNPELVAKIMESKQQAENGNYTTVKKEDLKEFLGL
jgi:hypothetical protein